MTYQQIDKFTCESVYEACTMAAQKYGKDNYEVLTSRRIKHPIYLGLGHQELVEITVGVKSASGASRPLSNKVPSRPQPSTELNMPKQQTLRFTASEPQESQAEASGSLQAKPKPAKPALSVVAPVMGAKSYAAAKNNFAPHDGQMRTVHSLRSIQEGNLEPQPSHTAPKDIDILLSHIQEIKDERKRLNKRENKAAAPSIENKSVSSGLLNDGRDMQRVLSSMEDRLNRVCSIVDNLSGYMGSQSQAKSYAAEEPSPINAYGSLPRGLCRVKQALEAIETPSKAIEQVIGALRQSLPLNVLNEPKLAMNAALNWLEGQMGFSADIGLKSSGKPTIITLIGPTGVGKTTTLAKLAATYHFGSQCSLALFNIDTYRVGATEQLDIYANITEAEIEIIYSASAIQDALNKHRDKDLIIVDTAGRSHKATQDIEELSEYIGKLPNSMVFLVISSTSKYTDIIATIKSFSRVGFDKLIFTKTDETSTVGPLLATLLETKKSLAYITTGQNVPTDFKEASFDFFREQLTNAL